MPDNDPQSFNWQEYLETRFTDPAALMAWQLIVSDPFYLYRAGEFEDVREKNI